MTDWTMRALWMVAVTLFISPAAAAITLDCETTHRTSCQSVLPGAVTFEAASGKPWKIGKDADGTLRGWLALSTDLVDIKAYSGKPLVTLVGLDPEAVITGAKVIKHSEPILLIGLPKDTLDRFVEFYKGKKAIEKIVVGSTEDSNAVAVDIVSGATVTILAQNQTILETARKLGVALGVINAAHLRKGWFVKSTERWTWAQMVQNGTLGRLYVTEKQMGYDDSPDVFIDLYYTIADAPQVGIPLLGESEWKYHMARLKPGEHLFVVLGNGTSSFKGSGFVRGGIFDRVRLEQGLGELMFRDRDYTNLSGAVVTDAPRFKEGALFVLRGGRIDPGAAFEMVFTGSRYSGVGGFERVFNVFKSSLKLPASVYEVEEVSAWFTPLVRQAWFNQRLPLAILLLVQLMVMFSFIARRWLTSSATRLRRIHTTVLVLSFVVLGLGLRAQPSITQVLTLVGTIVDRLSPVLFLTDPIVFVSWIFIAVVTVIWGRGVFCGWVCPYGALTELLFKLGGLLKLKRLELPTAVHNKLRWLRYLVLFGLIPVFLVAPETGEMLAEIEPFKSTFFVPAWTRPTLLFVWWVLLLLPVFVWYRPFCRYICPLGAALSVGSSVRFSGPRRRDFCSKCKICTRICESNAIRPDGTIDPRECLSCMECEANYRDDEICPPLVKLARKARGKRLDPAKIAEAIEGQL